MKLPRHSEIWLLPYIADRFRKGTQRGASVRRVWLAITDHWEPFSGGADAATAKRRVAFWRDRWPEVAARIRDSAGNSPTYSFFYPEEEYRREFLDGLGEMVRDGIADVEVHIHHDGEGRDNFIGRMTMFCRRLAEDHGLLRERQGRLAFGFIHGNWALDNSRPDERWCGLNDEISILRDLGCYADYTMPSGNHPSQARTLNSIYWCKDDPGQPKSYDKGIEVQVGGGILPDLLMVSGPFGLRWKERLTPRMETGELAVQDPPTRYRAKRWFDLAPRVGEDMFIKLFAHGAEETNATLLLNGGLNDAFTFVKERASLAGAEVYFVSAWQMYLAVAALCNSEDPVKAAIRFTTGGNAKGSATADLPATRVQPRY